MESIKLLMEESKGDESRSNATAHLFDNRGVSVKIGPSELKL